MKTLRLILILVVVILVAGAGIWIWRAHKSSVTETITIEEGRIVDLRPIAELCSMEIYRESAVRDTLNGKILYGIQKQQGRITFDLSSLPSELQAASSVSDPLAGDTIRLTLPKEKIYLTESTAKNSWRVIDTKSTRLFGNARMTVEEENIVKRRAINRGRRKLYTDGTVGRARREASVTLRRVAESMTGRPVVVSY